jgi:hypothetical protein
MDARQRTVGHLQELNTVVAGLALTLAITKLFETKSFDERAAVPSSFEVLPYFVAYVFTLVPIYHGAMRHLDVTYFEDKKANVRSGALMFDWALLFIESCFLLGLAYLMQKPTAFGWALCIFLGFDCLWAFIANLGFAPKLKQDRPEWKWATINFVAVCILVLTLAVTRAVETKLDLTSFTWIPILVVCVARTIWDYAWCWSYYYPSSTSRQRESAKTAMVRQQE